MNYVIILGWLLLHLLHKGFVDEFVRVLLNLQFFRLVVIMLFGSRFLHTLLLDAAALCQCQTLIHVMNIDGVDDLMAGELFILIRPLNEHLSLHLQSFHTFSTAMMAIWRRCRIFSILQVVIVLWSIILMVNWFSRIWTPLRLFVLWSLRISSNILRRLMLKLLLKMNNFNDFLNNFGLLSFKFKCVGRLLDRILVSRNTYQVSFKLYFVLFFNVDGSGRLLHLVIRILLDLETMRLRQRTSLLVRAVVLLTWENRFHRLSSKKSSGVVLPLKRVAQLVFLFYESQ